MQTVFLCVLMRRVNGTGTSTTLPSLNYGFGNSNGSSDIGAKSDLKNSEVSDEQVYWLWRDSSGLRYSCA